MVSGTPARAENDPSLFYRARYFPKGIIVLAPGQGSPNLGLKMWKPEMQLGVVYEAASISWTRAS